MNIIIALIAVLGGAVSALVTLWIVERRRTRLFKKAFSDSIKGFQKELVTMIVELTAQRHPLALRLLHDILLAVAEDQYSRGIERHVRKSLADERFADINVRGRSVIPPMPVPEFNTVGSVTLQEANLPAQEAGELKLAARAQVDAREALHVKEIQEYKKSPEYRKMLADQAALIQRMEAGQDEGPSDE